MYRTILLLLTCAFSCFANTSFILCSTGDATATLAGCGSAINSPGANNLTSDGNWYASSNASGTFLSQAFVTINNASPLQNAGPWLANNTNDVNGFGAGSSWITPTNNQGNIFSNGTFFFSTQFNLTGLDATLAAISGYWLADDYGAGVFLNGVPVGQTGLPLFGGETGPMVPFTIAAGNPAFQAGQNTLTFAITNDSTNHGAQGGGNTPTGIRVLITESDTPAPEPNTTIMLAAGFAVVGFLVSRRKRRA